MVRVYLNIIKKYSLLILTLGFAYGATIVFTFWGPVLSLTGGSKVQLLSIIAVLAHVLGFYFKPRPIEKSKYYFTVFLIILIPLVLYFYRAQFYLKAIIVILYAFLIARVGCFWAYRANQVIPNHIRGRVISASLLVSFCILYFVNISLPMLPVEGALVLPVALSILAVVLFRKAENSYSSNILMARPSSKAVPSSFLFVFLVIVYIAGGFSYAGIYPSFAPFAYIDRYYNVLFYIIAILIGGVILDTYGRKVAFTLGVAFLGISFTFFIMPQSVITYFVTQTFLQAGWAFVNSYGWSFSWDIAEHVKRPELFPRGISAMLFGSSLGGVLANVMKPYGLNLSMYGLVTFIPLFLAIILLVYFPETLRLSKAKAISLNLLSQLPELRILTPRELEVSMHLANGATNKQICCLLYISDNTVKTHVRNIYSKLVVSSRHELREYINGCLNNFV